MEQEQKKFDKLGAAYRTAEMKYFNFVRETIEKWLRENGNSIEIPKEYETDFCLEYPTAERCMTKRIVYESECVYLEDDDENRYYLEEALSDKFTIDVAMNFYFGNPPFFGATNAM